MTTDFIKSNPYFLLVIVPFIWGINFTIMKVGLIYMEPIPYNTARLIVAAIIAWIFVFSMKKFSKIEAKDIKPLVLVALIGFALPQICITFAVKLTTAGNCALLMALVPVSVLIINKLFKIEEMTLKVVFGIMLSLSGVILVIIGSTNGFTSSNGDLLGIIILLVAQFLAAYFTVFSKDLVQKYSAYQVIAYTMTISALVFLLISGSSLLNTEWKQIELPGWLSIFYSGIFALSVGNFIWVWAASNIGSAKTAVFYNLTPLFGIITGCVFLGEYFGLKQMLGAVVIITGVYLTTQKSNRIIYKQIKPSS